MPSAIEIERQLNRQGKTIGIVLGAVRDVLDRWQADIIATLEMDPELLAEEAWWVEYANTEMQGELERAFGLAMQEAIAESGLTVSWTRINPEVRALSRRMAFQLVNLENPQGIVAPRVGFLDEVRGQLASGELPWTELEDKLQEMFSEYRARLIARTETTTLWAQSHAMAARESGMRYKRSIRAELRRPCPTNVCIEAQEEGWIPIGDAYMASGTDGPAYHPHCYCYEQFGYDIPEEG